ncbi:MAG: FGGY-family carbohydrate kinase [Chloroflexota bacterium]
MTQAVLAIDLGTSEVKVGLVGLDGSLLGVARRAYPTELGGGPGWAEQDPEQWWDAIVDAVGAAQAGSEVEIVAVGLDGHGPSLVPVDGTGCSTRAAITWQDTRAVAEAGELSARTGLRGWTLGGLPAALWIERHEPATAARTRWYLATWEWLAFRLTGRAAAPLVPDQRVPDAAALGAAGIARTKLPEPLEAGSVVGGLTATAAAGLGLPAGLPIVAGMVDAFASYLGAGLLEPGDAFDPGGAAGGLGVYWDRPLEVPGAFTTSAPLRGLYSIGAAMAATGRSLEWFRDQVLRGAVTIEELLLEAAQTAAGADGLVFLPYLAGERSPLWDPTATGLIAGLTLAHGRGHIARAIVEASALALRHVAAPMVAAGVRIHELRVCGGPARSDFWNQVKADVTGLPVAIPVVLETALLGSAIVATVAIGGQPDLRAAIAAMTRIDHRLEPDPAVRGVYDDLFARYAALYPATAPILRGDSALLTHPAAGPAEAAR